jgi:TolB-like protein/tetratricopeptide (TPR) repeat protein
MNEEVPASKPLSETSGKPAKAVFLSYASQDAVTARRIAEALRAVGIEVWLDQAELAGGDAWDREIRQQIQSCALFVPIISANTESRPEGYFRLEWWLAEQRGFRMAKGQPFLVPVVTDVPRTADAQVPDAFREVQWTRLEGGRVPADFAARVQALLAEGVVRPGSAGAPAASRPQPALIADDKSIAVLAFVNLSSDKENEYFSDGIAEELLNLLAKVTQLRVIARTSSFSFKGKDVPIADIARRLNVAHVLEGSVRKAGNRVRVTAQLIRAADSTHLWSETYDRELDDIFAVQDDIAAEVVEQLQIRLLSAAPRVLETSSEAYVLYLQARQLARQNTAAGYTKALALLDRVLQIEPDYAPAWTMKSTIYGQQGSHGLISEPVGLRLAREAANRALALDPKNSNAYRRLGWSAIADARDFAGAARYFAQAWALSPIDLGAISSAAWLYKCLGRFEQALALDQHIVSRDPENADSHLSLGSSYYLIEHFEQALASYRTALGLNPERFGARFGIARTLLRLGRPEDALASAQEETGELWRLCAVTMVMHALGRESESDAAIAQLIAGFPDAWYQIAYLQAYRGEADLAFESLERAVTNRDAGLGLIAYEPLFASLHDDPRWLPFLQEIGMAPEQLDAIPFDVQLPT